MEHENLTPLLSIRTKQPAVPVSYLYTPAPRIESLMAKRQDVAADVVVVDLEDSVHVKAKAAAREKVCQFDFSPLTKLGIRLALRVNTICSFDGLRDLEMLRERYERGDCAIESVLLPKINHPSEIRIYRSLFDSLKQRPRLICFIETIEAVENADAIASVSDAICFGQADLCAQMYGSHPAFLDYARTRMCVAAARYHIQAIDTSSFEIHDLVKFEGECAAARECGFTGKVAIHPNQVEAINRIFGISGEIIAGYQRTIDAYLNADVGFAMKDGQVVAPPFVAKARMMLAAYDKWTRE
ncbi:MAG TPA: aldolase/citrate lyase family protein [Thermoanaerobaculia bacterium]|jgi:citrate lyase beta subunit|nr:aldolase/citrate lyase family protein [Thermoanaerobaculia bacterium]